MILSVRGLELYRAVIKLLQAADNLGVSKNLSCLLVNNLEEVLALPGFRVTLRIEDELLPVSGELCERP